MMKTRRTFSSPLSMIFGILWTWRFSEALSFRNSRGYRRSSVSWGAIRILFYLLFICSCLIVHSEIHFSESLCFIGTSQFISSVYDLTPFYLMWVFTEFNLRTHMWAVFDLCVPFYKPAFDIIYLIAIRFSIIDVSSYQEGFHLFVFDAG